MRDGRIPHSGDSGSDEETGDWLDDDECGIHPFPRGGDENIRREEHDPAEKDENKRRDLLSHPALALAYVFPHVCKCLRGHIGVAYDVMRFVA